MKLKVLSVILIFILATSWATAQRGFSGDGPLQCGEEGLMKNLFSKNPAIESLNKQIDLQLAAYIKQGGLNHAKPFTQTVTLPVVVHIIHNNGPENISDATVLAGIQHLNEAYANSGYYDPADGVNTNIQFCMAQRDPNGNPTNGITRNVSAYTNMAGPDYYTDDQHVKNLNRWNPLCYINIWLVNDIPGAVAGYAYLPSAHGSNVDGIVEEAQYFGSSYTNDIVIIHEMGHYLGLYHTFEGGCTNADCTTDGDKVCDTPPDNSTAFASCSIPVNSCSTDTQSGFSTDQNDLTSDYMDYGNWSCMTVFTQGQSDRMNWFITNVLNSLLNCKSCLPPCPSPVTANFNSSSTTVSAGTTVNFSNISTNGVTYHWYINNVLQASTFNFSNLFNTPGIFTVKLTAAGNNSALCDSSGKEQLITVTCPVNSNFSTTSTEIPVGQSLTFTGSATGSPSTYAWYINNVLSGSAPNLTYAFTQPGSYTIMLTVGNGICTSTKSITIDVTSPCQPNSYFEKLLTLQGWKFAPRQTLILADSSIVLIGVMETFYPAPYVERDCIIKLSKSGNILWSKSYWNGILMYLQRIIQLSDGNLMVAGMRDVASLNAEPFVMKLDNNGQIIWKKSYTNSGINDFYHVNGCSLTETPGNGAILGIAFARASGGGSLNNTYLLRIDQAGNRLWNKEVVSMVNVKKLELRNNSLYGMFEFSMNQIVTYLAKLDLSTGNVAYAQKYSSQSNGNPLAPSRLQLKDMNIFNDRIKMYGVVTEGGGIGDTGSHVMMVADTFGILQQVKRLRFTDPQLYITANLPDYYRHGTILNNGEFSFFESGISPIFPWPQKIFLQHADVAGNGTSTNLVLNNSVINFHYAPDLSNDNDNIKDRGNGNLITVGWAQPNTQTGTTPTGLIVYSSDYAGLASASCPITPGPSTYFQNDINSSTAPEFSVIPALFTDNPVFNVQDSIVQFSSQNICTTNNTVSCYSVRISLSDTLCVGADSATINCHRNIGCTEPVIWTVSSPAQNAFHQLNDTTIKVKFTGYGNYTITAAFASCSSINDTAHVFISKNASLLSLGADKSFCTFSTLVLNAGSGFRSYIWNNGSTDSTLTAEYAGDYYVAVRDYCNNLVSDTIHLTQVAAPAFHLPNDTTICNADTLSIIAPAGFSNYTWASNYHINTQQGISVRVWPTVDTVYTVTATSGTGCTVLDSIRIAVKSATAVNIGPDSSVCSGDSIHLIAGSGFTGYTWSTGATSSSIYVSAVGLYTVAANNPSGCISRDSMRVLNIYPKPLVNLGTDQSICKNNNLILNAGSGFTGYTWQDNSHGSTLSANHAGLFWVQVMDIHGCKSRDSLTVFNVFDTAANIIGPSFSECAGQPKYIKPNGTYNSYLWSTGSHADSVIITQPGQYSLTVSNSNDCVSTQNFTVIKGDCITGILFPNSFTPNHDGKNDIFKATGTGEFDQYLLQIYDRYGMKLFESTDPNKGWDGSWKSKSQPQAVYVWICSYKIRNGLAATIQGTVLLLR